ncbi:MAG: diaminopimelate decarboxylase [Muribaculaceae bacterium]|nr:diaminopimelate decarboxylase [Muribaculaceae bacterium]
MDFPLQKFDKLDTPFYYYDLNLLRATLGEINDRAAISKNFRVHYAIKANTNPTVLHTIAQAGLGADCVSGGEIMAAVAAGFPAEKIMFAGVGKTDKEINIALDNDILCFNVESVPELEVIDKLAAAKGKCARVALRVNPDVDAHTHTNITTGRAEDKFGIDLKIIDEVVDLVGRLNNVELFGLHFHIGSQILDMNDFVRLCDRINPLISDIEAKGIIIRHINVGGGLGIDYVDPDRHPIPDFAAYFGTFMRHLALKPYQTVHFELGRAVVAQCGTLVSRVVFVKEGMVKKFVIIDAGMNDLIRPALYGAYHKIENLTSKADESEVYDVVGPVCESSDVFGKDVELPLTARGDIIAIRSAGAYGEIMASQYNCRPFPRSVISD